MKQMTLKRLLALMFALLLMLSLCACGGKPDNGDDNKEDAPPAIGETMINAVHYGVDNTGKTDMTDKIIEMHEKGAELNLPIYYPNGTYLFNGLNLNFDSGVQFESMDGVLIRNSVADTNIINFDDKGNLIGLMHNHLEAKFEDEDFKTTYQNGNLVSPPLADISYDTVVDFVPYWYNDFGRQCTLAGGHGWKGWYDWQWNHHDIGTVCTNKLPVEGGAEDETVVCGAALPKMDDPYERAVCPECGATAGYDQYDPDLHPLIGWYRGDDPVALDWMAYWLQEYGMKQAVLLAGATVSANWEDPNVGVHWVYELMHSPNGKQMKYALNLASGYGPNDEELRTSWWNSFGDFYFNEELKDMVYCYEKDGKRYATFFLWDESASTNGVGGSSVLKQIYKDAAAAMKENGYDGICVLARFPAFANDGGAASRAELEEAGVLWYSASYPNNCLMSGATYGERVDRFITNPDNSCLYGVSTGMNTHTPHPSAWNLPGSTPEIFGKWIQKAVDATVSIPEHVQMITCYNISEWSEGGPGLVPTVGQRFGYLEAIRDNIVAK